MAIAGQFQFRRDLASAWATVNPILLDGELGIESDTDLFKIGDGTTPWNGLPYGGLQGEAGQASQTIVGATTVINPNQNPSVTDADAGPNADLRFSLPRAREVTAQTTNTVSPGTAASVTQIADAEGDVLLTFNIPRGAAGWSPLLSVVTDGERRVLRLVDYVGGEGTKPTIPTDNYIGATGLTNLANAVDIRGAVGATGPAANSFTNIAVAGQNTVSADQANDTLTLVGAGSVSITTDAVTDSIVITGTATPPQNTFAVITGNTGTATADAPADTLAITGGTGISTNATDTPDGLVITNTDTGSAARAAHEAAADPHPQYTTAAEASAAAPVQSVNGQTGNVTITVPTPLNANRVGLFTSTANSTAVQPFLTLTIPANRIVAGHTYSFFVVGTQSQSAAATNVVFTVQVNGTTIATATVAGGTAAQTNRGLTAEGMIQFTAAGAAGQVMGGIQSVITGIAANGQTNVAGVAVNTTANVTITLTAQTSTANAANIIRVAAASISERA